MPVPCPAPAADLMAAQYWTPLQMLLAEASHTLLPVMGAVMVKVQLVACGQVGSAEVRVRAPEVHSSCPSAQMPGGRPRHPCPTHSHPAQAGKATHLPQVCIGHQ
jgi:hypothetical protein